MTLSKTKERLLNTRMTDLGLGSVFNKYFLLFPQNANKRLKKYLQPLEPSMTLKEFFEKNPARPKGKNFYFKCAADGTGFSNSSASYQKLRSLLLQSGFTAVDWSVLATKANQLNLFPFLACKTADLLPLPVTSICMLKTSSAVYKRFQELFEKDAEITIEKLLAVTQHDIEAITGTLHNWKISYEEVQAFRRFVVKLQAKLERLGFSKKSKEHRPFMNISFKKENKPRGSYYYFIKKYGTADADEIAYLKLHKRRA